MQNRPKPSPPKPYRPDAQKSVQQKIAAPRTNLPAPPPTVQRAPASFPSPTKAPINRAPFQPAQTTSRPPRPIGAPNKQNGAAPLAAHARLGTAGPPVYRPSIVSSPPHASSNLPIRTSVPRPSAAQPKLSSNRTIQNFHLPLHAGHHAGRVVQRFPFVQKDFEDHLGKPLPPNLVDALTKYHAMKAAVSGGGDYVPELLRTLATQVKALGEGEFQAVASNALRKEWKYARASHSEAAAHVEHPEFRKSLKLHPESAKLFEQGAPGQGYFGAADLLNGTVYLMPGYNRGTKGGPESGKQGTYQDWVIGGVKRSKEELVFDPLGQSSGGGHIKLANIHGLNPASGEIAGFGIWKGADGISLFRDRSNTMNAQTFKWKGTVGLFRKRGIPDMQVVKNIAEALRPVGFSHATEVDRWDEGTLHAGDIRARMDKYFKNEKPIRLPSAGSAPPKPKLPPGAFALPGMQGPPPKLSAVTSSSSHVAPPPLLPPSLLVPPDPKTLSLGASVPSVSLSSQPRGATPVRRVTPPLPPGLSLSVSAPQSASPTPRVSASHQLAPPPSIVVPQPARTAPPTVRTPAPTPSHASPSIPAPLSASSRPHVRGGARAGFGRSMYVLVWQADQAHCQRCNAEMGWLKRHHHCRQCGRSLCNACTGRTKALTRPYSSNGNEGAGTYRVCDDCLNVPEDNTSALASW
jgi:hypothetical protein